MKRILFFTLLVFLFWNCEAQSHFFTDVESPFPVNNSIDNWNGLRQAVCDIKISTTQSAGIYRFNFYVQGDRNYYVAFEVKYSNYDNEKGLYIYKFHRDILDGSGNNLIMSTIKLSQMAKGESGRIIIRYSEGSDYTFNKFYCKE